ncbi:MAG: A/G-specific adenine glycosylase [Clostridiales bacterium]|nr:A/G-specific adenine glycosylase [Clostridiales bacterium]
MERQTQLSGIVFPLLEWFRDNARTLPWRSDPQPYKVWVSEIMLQQTRVAAVLDYFQRFMETFPTVEALAEGDEQQLLKLWQGLGYYNRARNLQKAARQIVTQYGGVFPSRYEDILSLSGVGEYTAGAIASIAFGQPVPAVDGNVLRVVTRLTGDDSDIGRPETKAAIRSAIDKIIPVYAPGQFNQSLMELGALVCLPNGAPLCDRCPLSGLCRANREGTASQLPVKAPKKPRRVERRTVWLIRFQGKIALRRRPDQGLLASLWEFPNTPEEEGFAPWPLDVVSVEDAGTGRHIFTHIEWQMRGVWLTLENDRIPDGGGWADSAALRETYPVPNAFSAFLPLVEGYLEGWVRSPFDGS